MEAAPRPVLGVRSAHKKRVTIGELPYLEFILEGASKPLIGWGVRHHQINSVLDIPDGQDRRLRKSAFSWLSYEQIARQRYQKPPASSK